MEYTPWGSVNPPKNPQPGVVHKTYHSAAMNHEVGYNIYLPPVTRRARGAIRWSTGCTA